MTRPASEQRREMICSRCGSDARFFDGFWRHVPLERGDCLGCVPIAKPAPPEQPESAAETVARLGFKPHGRPAPEQPARGDGPTASSACPICGVDRPHPHVLKDIENWVNGLLAAWGYRADVFSAEFYEQHRQQAMAIAWDRGRADVLGDFAHISAHPGSDRKTTNPYRVALLRMTTERPNRVEVLDDAPGKDGA